MGREIVMAALLRGPQGSRDRQTWLESPVQSPDVALVHSLSTGHTPLTRTREGMHCGVQARTTHFRVFHLLGLTLSSAPPRTSFCPRLHRPQVRSRFRPPHHLSSGAPSHSP